MAKFSIRLILSLCIYFLYLKLFKLYLQPKYGKRTFLYHFILFYIFFVHIYFCSISPENRLIVGFLFFIGLNKLLCKDSLSWCILFCSFSFLQFCVPEVLAQYILTTINGEVYENIFLLFSIIFIGNFIMYWIIFFIMKYISEIRSLFNWKLSISILFLEIGIFVIPYYTYFYQISKKSLIIFFVTYFIFIVSYIIFYTKYIKEKGLNESILGIEDIKNQEKNTTEFKELRHDVVNYIETLKILQENKERE